MGGNYFLSRATRIKTREDTEREAEKPRHSSLDARTVQVINEARAQVLCYTWMRD